MDIIIVGNVEDNHLDEKESLIPPFLVQKNNLPVLFHIIKYWMKYVSGKIYVLIPKKFIPICKNYLTYFESISTDQSNSDSEDEEETSKEVVFEDIQTWIPPSKSVPLMYEEGSSLPFTLFFSKYLIINQSNEKPSKKVFFTNTQYILSETIDLFKTYKRTYKDVEKKMILFSKDIASKENRGMSIDNIYNMLYTEHLENLNKKAFTTENFFFYTFKEAPLVISYPYVEQCILKRPFSQMDIECVFRDNRFFRKGKTPKGLSWIQKEVKFLSNWKKLEIPQQIQNIFPTLLQSYETAYVYSMPEKYNSYLHYLYSNDTVEFKNKNFFERIMQQMNQIHRLQKKTVEPNHWMNDLKINLQDKIQIVEKIMLEKKFLQSPVKVNGVYLQTVDEIVEKCKTILTTYYNLLENFRYVLIHGNLTFSNIFVNSEDEKDFVFANPTSVFGKNDLYGLKEYDESKVLLSLSGYDSLFYNNYTMNIDKTDNLTNLLFEIKKPELDKSITSPYFHTVHYTFVVLHWLHTPINVENDIEKSIFSYYYGLYLGTLL